MFDLEKIRNEELIEERLAYENSFFDMRDIQKSEEMNHTIEQYEIFSQDVIFDDIFTCEFDMEFDIDEYYANLRDEEMIESHLAYEELELSNIPSEALEKDVLEMDIEAYEQSLYEDYQIEFYDDFEDFYVCEEAEYIDSPYCSGSFDDYTEEKDPFDSLDGCDYPEGPDENLCGFKYPDSFYQVEIYEEPYIDYPDEFYAQEEPEYDIKDEMGIYLYEAEASHMQKLIDEHLKEEKIFLDFVSRNEVRDEYFIPSGIDDIVLC